MKWIIGPVGCLLSFGCTLSFAADPPSAVAPAILHVPYVFDADEVPTPTAAKLDVPFIPIGLDRDAFMKSAPVDATDASFISYLKALQAGDNATRGKYIAQDQKSGAVSMKADPKISALEIGSFFPESPKAPFSTPGTTLRIVGKIPIDGGAGYLITTSSKDAGPGGAFVTPVVAKGGDIPKVYLLNPFEFWTKLTSSLKNLDPLLKAASPGRAGDVFTPQNVADFFFSHVSPAAAGDILKCIDTFQKQRGKDCFTKGRGDGFNSSQDSFDKDFADLDTKNQDARLGQVASNARDIAYIIDLNPIYITVQKTRDAAVFDNTIITKDGMTLGVGSEDVFYYLRGKDGRLRFTGNTDEMKDTLKALPDPPAAVTQACADALKVAGAKGAP